jgi:6-phosphofructokinase 1
MGRTSGFIPAAARLADPAREIPLQIYFPEGGHTLESLADSVNAQLKTDGRCLLVVSEGIEVGDLGARHDDFGHIEYSSSKTTVAQQVVNYLNHNRLKARGLATAQVPGAIQRCVSLYASCVDIEEAYLVARHAVEIALQDGSGWMATILRKSAEPYEVQYDKAPLQKVANSERHLPRKWISKNRLDVTDEFVRYAMPLIGKGNPDVNIIDGRQRFARLNAKFIDRLTPEYQPVRMRV